MCVFLKYIYVCVFCWLNWLTVEKFGNYIIKNCKCLNMCIANCGWMVDSWKCFRQVQILKIYLLILLVELVDSEEFLRSKIQNYEFSKCVCCTGWLNGWLLKTVLEICIYVCLLLVELVDCRKIWKLHNQELQMFKYVYCKLWLNGWLLKMFQTGTDS